MFISVLTNHYFCTYHAHRVKRSFAPEAMPPKWTAATSDMARGELSITTTGQMGGFHEWSQKNCWCIMENPVEMDELGPNLGSPQMVSKKKVKWWELISKSGDKITKFVAWLR